MNNFKITILFSLIVFIFVLDHLASAEESVAIKYERVRQLIALTDQLETIFYSAGEMDSTSYAAYTQACEELIDLHISLGKQCNEKQFTEMAFAYLEKVKSQRLLKLFIPAVAPASLRTTLLRLLEKNQMLSRQYFVLRNKLLFEKVDKDSIQLALRNIANSMNNFWSSIQSNEPQLSLFLILQTPITPVYLQKYCLKENEAILNFWVHQNRLSIFIVTPDTFDVIELKTSADKIERHTNELTTSLFNNQDLLKLEFDYKLSNVLYMELFHPIEQFVKHAKTITMIPDNFLTGLPFEILISNISPFKHLNKEILYQNCRGFDFIIHKYAFCYNYTTTVLCPEAEKIRSRSNLGRKLLSLREPAVDKNAVIPFSEIDIKSLADFPESNYSANEIKRVARLMWRHRNLKGSEVTKEFLKKNGWKYRWFYFSQACILNNKNPLLSGLLFSKDIKDTTFFSCWLSCTEAMSCLLRADMITLSSCQTIPNLTGQGDGTIALPMAFLFSGIQSAVHSQWSVNSISTSQFMSKFYWELKYKRQTNASALREAKLASMKDTFHLSDQEISRAHPFFWAGFRLIGNPRVIPPTKNIIPPWGVVIIVYVILMTGILFITRKTAATRIKK